jgi:hypothetical protein
MMTEKPNHVSENIYSLIHELLIPLKGLVSAHSILDTKVPQTIEEQISRFGHITNELHTDIMSLFREPGKRINLQSADMASKQMQLLSSEWESDAEKLLQLVSQINGKNIHLEDDELDNILNQVLPNILQKFSKIVSYLTKVQAKHLILDDGFFYVLHIEK